MLGVQRKSGRRLGSRPLLCGFLAAGLLAGCGGDDEVVPQEVIGDFSGLVAADEPRAAVVGRDVLVGGGNAADAAVAMFFTMAVTLPSRAGIGSGGACVVFDNGDQSGEALVFRPGVNEAGGVVPLGARAMAALHARQGIARWGELLRPAENLARFGHRVSRAFARDLAAAAGQISRRPALARLFANESGVLAGEGDQIVQPELASVLSGIRMDSAGYLYRGDFAARYAALTAAAGLPVTVEELRDGLPSLTQAIEIEIGGGDIAYFPPPPAANGTVAALIWQILTEVESYGGQEIVERSHLFLEAAQRAFADRATWIDTTLDAESAAKLVDEERLEALMQDYDPERHKPVALPAGSAEPPQEAAAGSGFVVADRFGNAVACSFTLNGLFGSGQVAEGTGLILAGPPTPRRDSFISPTAVVVGNPPNGDLRFAAAASGGVAAASSMVTVMLGALEEENDLDLAIRAARIHHAARPDKAFYEKGMRREVLSGLEARGHALEAVESLGRVNAVSCPDGVRDGFQSCQAASDPRGAGLGSLAR